MAQINKNNVFNREHNISYRGYEFYIEDDCWILSRNIKLNISILRKFDKDLSVSIRETIAQYALSHSPSYVSKIVDSLSLYLRQTGLNKISVSGLLSIRAKLTKREEPKLATLRTFLRGMKFLGLSYSIENDVFELIDSWRLSGGDRGVPVLSLDPEKGPFSDMELESIGYKAAHNYGLGLLSVEKYLLIQLFKASGRRPEQIALLKVKDLKVSDEYGFGKIYILSIPRIKQRQQQFRSEFRDFGLEKSIGKLLERHIAALILKIEKSIGYKLNNVERSELPLFINEDVLSEIKSLKNATFLDFLSVEASHVKSMWVTKELQSAVNSLGVISERTGKIIHANPYRFRYTLGTRAAREGAGILTIACLLDHSDDQHAHVYVQNVPEYAAEISSIMNQPLMRYASAFNGRLVKDEAEADREVKGAARIPLREKDCDIGSCGTNSFCQENAPIACYLCPKFRPWRDAPHKLVLDWLIEERKRVASVVNNDKGNSPMASINDRAIIAVCQVIKLCEDASR